MLKNNVFGGVSYVACFPKKVIWRKTLIIYTVADLTLEYIQKGWSEVKNSFKKWL